MAEEKKSADEGEYPDDHAHDHASDKNRIADVALGMSEEVIEQVSEGKGGE